MNADRSSTWTARVTCLSDLTDEEVETTHTGRAPPPPQVYNYSTSIPFGRFLFLQVSHPPQDEMDRRSKKAERELLAPLRSSRTTLPASVDLTTEGRISPVKSQGSCGSCAVFATVSTIESCMHKVRILLPHWSGFSQIWTN